MLLGLTALPFGSSDITDAIASGFSIRRFEAERLKCVSGSAIASPADHREMIQIAPPAETAAADGARAERSIARAELVSIVTQNLAFLTREIARALKDMGFTGGHGGQIVLTGGGAELAGLAEYAQGALGRPCRVGRPMALRGLPEAHATPGFSTLAGLCLYAADDPVDIRTIGKGYQTASRYGAPQGVSRLLRALKEYF
jgi:cell division protein FtsA